MGGAVYSVSTLSYKEEYTMKVAHFFLLDPINNHNRVYNMTDIGNGIFEVEMGRQGASLVKKKYPISQWDKVYAKKIAEGYIDRISEYAIKSVSQSTYKDINNAEISHFVDYLLSCSRKLVEREVSIQCEEVSDKMISDAQELIGKIDKSKDLAEINESLIKLFTVIPRKMKDVKKCLPNDIAELPDILEREQSLLDAITTVKRADNDTSNSEQQTILEANNLEIREVTADEISNIKRFLTPESDFLFKRAFRVKNLTTEKKFYEYMESHNMTSHNIHYYYHGSSNANYWGIMTEGLSINPQAPVTGKMFGYGIYFAPRAKKSIGYTDLAGSYWRRGNADKAYLAVFKVCYKHPKHTETCEAFRGIHKLPLGYDVCYAHKGAQLYNDEVIIYNEHQCTIQYIIELKKNK